MTLLCPAICPAVRSAPAPAPDPWSEEAIPERDPRYRLPVDLDGSEPPTLSREEDFVWRQMVRRRPFLANFR